jgi:anti-sigma factor RsiW
MDCTKFEEIVNDLERPETEGFALRDSALAHAESCSHCARLMTDVESLDAALREISRSAADKHASPRVETSLMEEFRRQKASSSRRRVQRQIAALATAAVVLLVLGVSLHRRMAPNGVVSPVAIVDEKTSSSPSVPPVTTPTSSQQQDEGSANQADDSEYATAFVPLPYADDPTAVDGGTVVRVILSRPALASLGVPVTDPGATDRIPADLLLSEDGAPQAIRLVSQSRVDE